jgi:hypothetical protein
MSPSDSCFIQAISNNDNYHPKLSHISLVYYNDFSKGYIFVIDHSEGFSLDFKHVQDFVNKHSKVYVLDKKFHSYFFECSKFIDLQFVNINQTGKFEEFDCNTTLHRNFYQKYPDDPNLNKIIPISKHYEKCECMLKKLGHLVDLESDTEMENRLINAYKSVESNGLAIDYDLLTKKYTIQNKCYSLSNGEIYGAYNLYNTTGRPTNSFNGVNFLAIPKDKEFRQCFLPTNDLLVEFDFDSYHLRLIAKLTGYEWQDSHPHVALGQQYFKSDILTEDQYKKAKEITFKQLYGGIDEEYKNIPFFASLNSYIESEWKKYSKFGAAVLPTGRTIKKTQGLNKLQLFNYIVQNMETKENVYKIEKINDYLKDKKTKLVLITYDSFLFDFSAEDQKQTLIDIKNILQSDGMIVKHKYGKDYSF